MDNCYELNETGTLKLSFNETSNNYLRQHARNEHFVLLKKTQIQGTNSQEEEQITYTQKLNFLSRTHKNLLKEKIAQRLKVTKGLNHIGRLGRLTEGSRGVRYSLQRVQQFNKVGCFRWTVQDFKCCGLSS